MLDVTPVRAFSDNYIWVVHGTVSSKRVAVVDPGDAVPVFAHLEATGSELAAILVTHHHRRLLGDAKARERAFAALENLIAAHRTAEAPRRTRAVG